MEYKDYYEVLGVPKTATQDQIKKAYRKKARELHPDRNPGDAEAERRFKEANEAHAVLSDVEKRKRYDELGANWQAYEQAGFGGAPGGATDWAGFGGAPGGTRWEYRRVSPEDLGGFSDFFQAFFSGASAGPMGAGTASRPGSQRFEQAFEFGDFSSAGFDTGDFGPIGTRRRTAVSPPPSAAATAEVTLAEVARGAERMVDVDGRRLQVKIPAGVNDGAKIKLRGGGVRGGDGGSAGDLVITVRVKPDPRFERHGADLTTELPLTLAEAMLGAEIPVPTPTGSVKLRIRPNTQNGQEIHVRGRGLPKRGAKGEKGDLIVRARVVLPKLDEEGRQELRALLDKHPQPNPRGDGRVH